MKKSSTPQRPPKEFWEDYRWANAHYREFLKSHCDQWIGIHEKKVVAADPDLSRVESLLSSRFPGTLIPLVFVSDASHVY